jgi:hypothetical protein
MCRSEQLHDHRTGGMRCWSSALESHRSRVTLYVMSLALQSKQSPLSRRSSFQFVCGNRELLALAGCHDEPSFAVFYKFTRNRELKESVTETVNESLTHMVQSSAEHGLVVYRIRTTSPLHASRFVYASD